MIAHCLLAGILAGTVALDPPGVVRRANDAEVASRQDSPTIEGPTSTRRAVLDSSNLGHGDESRHAAIAVSQTRASRRLRNTLPGVLARTDHTSRSLHVGLAAEPAIPLRLGQRLGPPLGAFSGLASFDAHPRLAHRSGAVGGSPAEQPSTSDSPATLDPADLSARAEQAQEQRRGDPTSPQRWMEEGAALEALGDLNGAILAYETARSRWMSQLEADGASPDAAPLGEIDAKLESLRERARGAVEDEPASTHRERLDDERAQRLAAQNPTGPVEEPPVDQPKKERIVKKWYFWVTILAITASGAAVTGIAIQAARQDRLDDLDRSAPLSAGGGASLAPGERAALLRF